MIDLTKENFYENCNLWRWEKAQKRLTTLIGTSSGSQGIPYEIQEYESGDALLKDEHKEDIQLLFLDIEMPGKGGMETAHGLRDANLKMLIYFVTAYPDYVFRDTKYRLSITS